MLTHLAERFRVIPVSAFIYAVANCVGLFGDKDNGAYVAMLYEAVWSVTTSLFHMLNSLELFEKKPDLIEEYYCLLTKVIMSCPTPFLESPDTSSLIEAGNRRVVRLFYSSS